MSRTIPRFLFSREYLLPHHFSSTRTLGTPKAIRRSLPTCKHASTTTPVPRVIRLAKPDKFNPPSHGKRLKQYVPRHYGPPLNEKQKAEQDTKRYPRMFPPKGTFMFWVLTSTRLHFSITLGTLVFLAFFTAFENWRLSTYFRDQLPELEAFVWHPIQSTLKLINVWRLNVARTTRETQERRMREIADVQKRSTYRRAHGLEGEESQGLGGWTAKSDEESLGPSPRAPGVLGPPERGSRRVEVDDDGMPVKHRSQKAAHVDWEGNRRPLKKWLGIW